MTSYDFGTPGVRADRGSAPREILLTLTGAIHLPGGRVLDGAKARDPLNAGDPDVLRPGVLLGRITSSGKYAPSILGLTTQAYADNDTTLTVSPATATEIARRIGSSGTFKLTGPPTAGGTVASLSVAYTAVNTGTGAITVPDLNAAFVAGSLVRPADGSETPLGLLDEEVKATDAEGNGQGTRLSRLLVGGVVRATQLVNYPADGSLRAFVKAALKAAGPFVFDDDF